MFHALNSRTICCLVYNIAKFEIQDIIVSQVVRHAALEVFRKKALQCPKIFFLWDEFAKEFSRDFKPMESLMNLSLMN